MIKKSKKIAISSFRNSLFSTISLGKYLNSHNLIYKSTSNNIFSDEQLDVISYFTQLHPKLPYFSAYCGFDPTSSALHLGNFISIMTLIRLSFFGIKPIFLIGGATGLIGDPSGKSIERKLLQREEVKENTDGIENTIKKVVDNICEYIKTEEGLDLGNGKFDGKYYIENNARFYEKLNIIEFIRDFGKHFRMQELLKKETVANRLTNEDGISYAEFSYQLLQAYDFYQLYLQKNCLLQIGGSDQWGNITNGCDLIRKILRKEVFGLTTPLLLTSSGKKFGKSEGNAIWLTSDKTKQYDMFQYCINISDADVGNYLRLFTFFTEEKITEVVKKHKEKPELRTAQNLLGETIVKMLYFDENKNNADENEINSRKISKKFFETDFKTFKTKENEEIKDFFKDITPKYSVNLSEKNNLKSLPDLLVYHKIAKTKSEVRRNIESGGVYINDNRITLEISSTLEFLKGCLLAEKYFVLRIGRKKYYLMEILS